MLNPLRMTVLGRAYRREVTPSPPLSWVANPPSVVLAPVGRLLGYRARYDKYSGPRQIVGTYGRIRHTVPS